MRLKFYEASDSPLIEQYTLSEEQLCYTMSPQASIELVKTDKSRHAVLALKEGKLVTFLVFTKKKE